MGGFFGEPTQAEIYQDQQASVYMGGAPVTAQVKVSAAAPAAAPSQGGVLWQQKQFRSMRKSIL